MPPHQLRVTSNDSATAPTHRTQMSAVLAHERESSTIPCLADDLLRGAADIASFVFGDPRQRRAVYHLAVEVKPEHRMPVFRLGNVICARRSTLLRWIGEQEKTVLAAQPGTAESPAQVEAARSGGRR